MSKIIDKLYNKVGESIGETLIALLVASLALIMLAGAISSSSRVVMRSSDKMNEYYSANETTSGIVKMNNGSPGTVSISDTTATNPLATQSYNVSVFQNSTFSDKTVTAYKKG